MAQHLLDEHYKDAAAVIAGSSLEEHLRLLAATAGLATTSESPRGPRPLRADALNSALANAGIYSKLDQKSITAWLDLRNKAAHGLYSEYDESQVGLMVDGIRLFMMRVGVQGAVG